MPAPDKDAGDDTLCPIAHSTGLVGDRWSILIVRELLFGQGRFQDLQAQTGATSQMLAARLKRLEADGLVERHAYSQRPLRHEYRLTPWHNDPVSDPPSDVGLDSASCKTPEPVPTTAKPRGSPPEDQ